ncbi:MULTISPECIES: hypothetical protein [Pseudomonas]|uniref:hypothetical protein n=1 Tax=Pseudomonas TaxID=286 RepID=UPI0013E0307D|nr:MULTISPECIES: hypothetical protein [Pseudomonas]MCE0912612.1 hypothetical protein [Pseudomonas kurunegalensis]QIG19368.1 hypothetical protein FY041_17265 [Pseudomonas monteilii]QIG24623.1 hypothetical protein FY043_17260 [Pseudomonas monteilii]WJR54065.1 hypothetical protein LU664_017020 [Pseudomonas kurunegalensis]WMM94558.1 hypothetical protein [Pseudomonas kurunegalensis]
MLNDYGKSLFKPWLSVQNVVLVLAGIFVACLAIRTYSLNSSEVASWVQAFGSIAAIWGAFAISNGQVRKAEEERKEEGKQRLAACYAVIQSAADHSNSLSEMIKQGPPHPAFKYGWDSVLGELFQASLNSLKQIPAHELGSYELVVSYQGITGSVAKILSLVSDFKAREAFLDSEAGHLYGELLGQCYFIGFRWAKFKEASGFIEPSSA